MIDPSATGRFRVSGAAALLFVRAIPGMASIGLSEFRLVGAAAVSLLLAVLADLVADSFLERRGWKKSASDMEIEGFIDFTCFVWAPVQLAVDISSAWPVLVASAVFVLAGGYRLARFNIEGTVDGGYVGLPVTYSGVALPAACFAMAGTDALSAVAVLTVILLVMAWLMASRRFIVRRISL